MTTDPLLGGAAGWDEAKRPRPSDSQRQVLV